MFTAGILDLTLVLLNPDMPCLCKQCRSTGQQIILGAFGYLTPSKFNQLGKIIFSFFGLSKDSPQNEN